MKKNTRKRAAAVATGAALALVAGGVAYGYWTTSGSGTGTAGTGNTQNITINAGPVTGLYPGAAAKNLSGTFTNPNPGSVRVTSMTFTVASVDKAGCDKADFVVTNPTSFTADVDPGTAVGSWSGATIALKNDPVKNQDACKDATVTLALASN